MDVNETQYFGLCKCCLRDGCFKCMWVEYNEGGDIQNYGEMLNECFALCWEKPDNDHLDHICDSCIQRTKEAYSFRKQILTSQDRLNNVTVENKGYKIEEIEYNEPNYDTEDPDAEMNISYPETFIVKADIEDVEIYGNNDPNNTNYQEENDPHYLEDNYPDHLEDNDPDYLEDNDPDYLEDDDPDYVEDNCIDDPPEVFEEVEYLEFDNENDKEAAERGKAKELTNETHETPERKCPKQKRKGGRRSHSYRNYSEEDLKESLAAVKNGKMTRAQASQHYNVPRKTIAAKLLMEKRGEVPKLQTTVSRKRYVAMTEEVKTILTYTNATPFKTRTAHYHCAYCSTAGPVFEDADELRIHTRTQHAGERTKSVEEFLKPLWLNEVLKVDIENLHCTVCCVILVSWNDMFKHLKDQHSLDFDEAYTRVIPYILKRELRCALCKEAFPNYHHLDSHMNAHYNNYVCSECGDTFLSETRLKKHEKIHEVGLFPCDECSKTFTLEKYRKKHVIMVHKQEHNIKCLYCVEKFSGTYARHLHVMQFHKEKVSFITCEMCGKTFDWRPYYMAHIRRKHNNEKKYQCESCDAHFFMKSELTRHRVSHTGEKFVCGVCKKQFSTKWSLTIHFKMHLGDKWKPGVKLIRRKRECS